MSQRPYLRYNKDILTTNEIYSLSALMVGTSMVGNFSGWYLPNLNALWAQRDPFSMPVCPG